MCTAKLLTNRHTPANTVGRESSFPSRLHQSFVLALGESHEGAVLRTGDALDVLRVSEVAQVLVGLADAVVLGAVAVLYVGHAPRLVANELEGAGSLAPLASFEAYVVVLHGFAPSRG